MPQTEFDQDLRWPSSLSREIACLDRLRTLAIAAIRDSATGVAMATPRARTTATDAHRIPTSRGNQP